MRFSVFSLSPVPDTATTRRLFELDDLDDEAVSKVLFHRRKQQTGASEVLRWDQQAIAGMTLITHSVDDVDIESLHLGTHTEEEMLQAFYRSALRSGHMVSWDGSQTGLPLIHFRSLIHGVSYPPYWQAMRERDGSHLDIAGWLSPGIEDRPALDETARKLGLPGLLGHDEDGATEAWLERDYDALQAYSDIAALNTYVLALRLFATTGEMTRHDGARVRIRLRDTLGKSQAQHLAEFLSAWGDG